MAVTHVTILRNTLADAVNTAIGAGGKLVILTAADAVVATITGGASFFAAAVGGTMTANATTDDTNAVGGTAAKFALRTSADADQVLGSVTLTGGGGDIEMTAVDVGAGSTVSLTSLTYTAAP